jgi:CRISPR-associated protein Cas2
MTNRILYLAAYDVCSPERLQDALHALKAHASGGQKSVFECYLSEAERSALLAEVRDLLDLHENRFMLLPLADPNGIRTLGIAVKPEDPEFYYVG